MEPVTYRERNWENVLQSHHLKILWCSLPLLSLRPVCPASTSEWFSHIRNTIPRSNPKREEETVFFNMYQDYLKAGHSPQSENGISVNCIFLINFNSLHYQGTAEVKWTQNIIFHPPASLHRPDTSLAIYEWVGPCKLISPLEATVFTGTVSAAMYFITPYTLPNECTSYLGL